MALIDLITEEVVKTPLVSTTKPEIIRELITILADAGKLRNAERVYDTVMTREDRGSTGLESGIAVPHCKTDDVDFITIAIGISPSGVEFDSLDGKPAQIFFLILAPPSQSGPHIEALSEIARLCRSQAFLRTLIASRDAKEILELIRGD